MTLPKKPKGEPPSPKCVLCRESPRPVGEFWCPPCAAHQARVRLTDKADYWLRRWLKTNRRRLPGLLAAYAPGRRPDLTIQVLPVGAA